MNRSDNLGYKYYDICVCITVFLILFCIHKTSIEESTAIREVPVYQRSLDVDMKEDDFENITKKKQRKLNDLVIQM